MAILPYLSSRNICYNLNLSRTILKNFLTLLTIFIIIINKPKGGIMKPPVKFNRDYFDALIISMNCQYCPIREDCPSRSFKGAHTIVYINNLCRGHWYDFIHRKPEPEEPCRLSRPNIFLSEKELISVDETNKELEAQCKKV
jgi:hypothetical protein